MNDRHQADAESLSAFAFDKATAAQRANLLRMLGDEISGTDMMLHIEQAETTVDGEDG
jgi:hypothetical protein